MPGVFTPPTGPPPDQFIGTVIADRYHVDKKLGEGGMGAVYLAKHIILDKQVALKVLHGEFAHRPDLVERFLHEAKAAARIRHEHVIEVSDFGQTATGNPFFCMEMLSGDDLAVDLKRNGPPSWPRTKSIVLQACSALQAAHEAGIIHRDLKPENMFLINRLGHPDFVKVLDFGIAKLTELEESGKRLTKTGMVFGTPEYMSPEQAKGDKTDLRVDVYAMGCILYHLITGDVPFRAETFMGVLTRHLFEEVPPIATRTQRTDLPAGIDTVIMRALEKDKDKRYQSMNELAIALDQLDVIPGVAYYSPGSSLPTTSSGAQAALLTPRTPGGGVPVAQTRAMATGTPAPSTPAPGFVGAAAAATVMGPAPSGTAPGMAAASSVAPGEGPTMADLAGGRQAVSGSTHAKAGKKTGLWIGLGVVVVGGAVAAVIALGGGGGGGAKAGEQPVVAPDKPPPVLEEMTPDAGAAVATTDADAGGALPADGQKPRKPKTKVEPGQKPPGDVPPPGDKPPGDKPPGDPPPGDGKPLKDPFAK